MIATMYKLALLKIREIHKTVNTTKYQATERVTIGNV